MTCIFMNSTFLYNQLSFQPFYPIILNHVICVKNICMHWLLLKKINIYIYIYIYNEIMNKYNQNSGHL